MDLNTIYDKIIASILTEDEKSDINQSLKRVRITKDFVKRYKNDYATLKHFDYDNDIGYAWVTDYTIAGMCAVDRSDRDNRIYITILDVADLYKKQGLGTEILRFCINKLQANSLTVRKTNKVAIHMYEKNGFKIVSENDRHYTMFLY